QSFSSDCSSRRRRVAGENHWLEESSRVWGVPPPHENDWLSRPDRQALWGAGDNAQLEHNTLSATDSEIPRARQVDRLSWERGQARIGDCMGIEPGNTAPAHWR